MSLPTHVLGGDASIVASLGLGLMSVGNFYGGADRGGECFMFLNESHKRDARDWDCIDIYGDTEELPGKLLERNEQKRLCPLLKRSRLPGRFCQYPI
jgi:aryl-alcohol dehydrogenase-like predicted oxidoreductase